LASFEKEVSLGAKMVPGMTEVGKEELWENALNLEA